MLGYNYLEKLQSDLGDFKITQLVKEFYTFGGDEYYMEKGFSFRIDDSLDVCLDANDIEDDDIVTIKKSLVEFSSADDMGGFLVFWLKEGIYNLDDAPIIWFGSDGEMEILASNFQDFIMLATTGNVFGDVREEQYDYITELPKFQTWVKEYLGLKVIEKQEDSDKIIQKANDTFKEPLFDWLKKNGAEKYALRLLKWQAF